MRDTQIHQYKVIIERGIDGYFVARVPSLPGCMTQGKTYEEVIDRAKEAIQLCRDVAIEDAQYRRETEEKVFTPAFIGIADVTV